jgi:hypothetical protein
MGKRILKLLIMGMEFRIFSFWQGKDPLLRIKEIIM